MENKNCCTKEACCKWAKFSGIEAGFAAVGVGLGVTAKIGIDYFLLKVMPTMSQLAINSTLMLLPIYLLSAVTEKATSLVFGRLGELEYTHPFLTLAGKSALVLGAAVVSSLLLGVSPIVGAIMAIVVIVKCVLTKPTVEEKLKILNEMNDDNVYNARIEILNKVIDELNKANLIQN